ncbi:MAG: AAA family ATPase [Clostridiales bacterium]|nr:AAA family ATPase [Candidatus Crickella merdequi]
MGRKIMIASGKGGTGKSTFAVNLGLTLAYEGRSVLLIDMNTGLRTLDLYLGLENRALFNISDVLNNICGLESAVLQTDLSERLMLLPGSQVNNSSDIDESNLLPLIESLSEIFDYIIMDCAPGIGYNVELCMACSDEAIIVINPDYASLRDADALEDLLLRNGVFNRSYVLNGISPDLIENNACLTMNEVDERMKCAMLGMILYDFNIKASTNAGVPITVKRDTYIAENYARIAERLIEKEL